MAWFKALSIEANAKIRPLPLNARSSNAYFLPARLARWLEIVLILRLIAAYSLSRSFASMSLLPYSFKKNRTAQAMPQ